MKLSRLIALILVLFFSTVMNVSAYVLTGTRWQASQVSYYINPANNDRRPTADVITDIRYAASTWQNQANISISLAYAGRTSTTKIGNNGRNEVLFRSLGTDDAVGTAYRWSSGSRIVEADIVFNDSYKWYLRSQNCSGGFYLANTAAHEFGHFLGLGHSTVRTATMYGTTSSCSKSRLELDADDLKAINSIY